jgi:branched-chain amino acid aminotransferase
VPDCVLDGITRRTVIALARGMGIEVIERPIMPDELGKTGEVFLTGTAAEVTPVGEIDTYKFAVGKITNDLMTAYGELVRGKKRTTKASAA